jgi:hypothetical protein
MRGTERSPNRRFEFQKSGQPFIGANNEPLTFAAMRINDKDRSPLAING